MVSKEEVKKLAALANLSFTEDKISEFSSQFKKILNYVGELDGLDLSDIEPMQQVNNYGDVLREDISVEGVKVEDVLKNASSKNDNFFKFPKVIDR